MCQNNNKNQKSMFASYKKGEIAGYCLYNYKLKQSNDGFDTIPQVQYRQIYNHSPLLFFPPTYLMSSKTVLSPVIGKFLQIIDYLFDYHLSPDGSRKNNGKYIFCGANRAPFMYLELEFSSTFDCKK